LLLRLASRIATLDRARANCQKKKSLRAVYDEPSRTLTRMIMHLRPRLSLSFRCTEPSTRQKMARVVGLFWMLLEIHYISRPISILIIHYLFLVKRKLFSDHWSFRVWWGHASDGLSISKRLFMCLGIEILVKNYPPTVFSIGYLNIDILCSRFLANQRLRGRIVL